MFRFPFRTVVFVLFISVLLFSCGGGINTQTKQPGSDSYADLVKFFGEWREFQQPRLINGVADYRAAAMTAQYEQMETFRQRLDQIDPSGWPVSQQVDHQIVLAEINGLEFDHRVLRPWARDPAFYKLVHSARSDVPAHEGPNAFPPIELWTYNYPLDAESAEKLTQQIRTIPTRFEGIHCSTTSLMAALKVWRLE